MLFERHIQFLRRINQQLEGEGSWYNPRQRGDICKELIRCLVCIAQAGEDTHELQTPRIIHRVWRSVYMTHEYKEFCRDAFGRHINFQPFQLNQQELVLAERINNLAVSYRNYWGQWPIKGIWPEWRGPPPQYIRRRTR